MKKVVYKYKDGYYKVLYYYEIKHGELILMEYKKCINKIKALFNQNTFVGFCLNKNETDKLLQLIGEEGIKEKFSIDFGWDELQKYCDKNKIKYQNIVPAI